MADPIILTVDAALEIEGREDTVQLAVQGHSTQNEALQAWEDESGTPVAQMQGDGRLEVNLLDLAEQGSAPGNPASGQVRLYAKDDGKVYAKDSAGVEHDLTAGSGGGSANAHLLIGEKSEDYDQYGSGWNTRVLTDIVYDETEGASLNSGEFSLPAGTYVYRAVAQAYGAAQAVLLRLYNVSDAQAEPGQHRVQAWGADEDSWVNVFLWGRFTIAESTTFRLEQYHGTSSGYGRTQINVPSEMEYHAFIELERQGSVGGQSSGGGGVTPGLFEARLSCDSASAEPIADVQNATSVWLHPFAGKSLSLFENGEWVAYQVASAVQLSLSGLTAGYNYDVFVYNDSGLTLEAVQWSDNSTRATALAGQDGVPVKSGATHKRYVGTFRTTATGQTEFSAAKRLVWNMYNRREAKLVVADTTSHTYTTAAWRPWNNNSNNMVEFVVGLAAFVCSIFLEAAFTGPGAAWHGISIDTQANVENPVVRTTISGYLNAGSGKARRITTEGYHYVMAMEYGASNWTASLFRLYVSGAF